MFAAMAGEAGCRSNEIVAMAAALPGRGDLLSRADPSRQVWLDESGAFAAAFRPMALLPEDSFDSQPFVDRELIFVCRARLDDRAGLLQRLQIDSARGATSSDADILRHCYKKWREETPRHVYGDFAFVAWERWSRRTVAATDHLGNFPLFYCRAGGRILFATQLGALLACPAVRARLDLGSLSRLAAGELSTSKTMFEDINVLPGGQLLVHHDEMLRTERWWRPDTAPRVVHAQPRDYVDEVKTLFESAVASRLRARGGVIATMSGGLDSTLVAVTAARQLAVTGKVMDALTAIPQPGLLRLADPAQENDDAVWAAAVAEFQPNIRQRLISPGGITPLDILPQVHAHAHTPVRDPANLVWLWQMTAWAAHNRVRVVLCGDHGNQSIGYVGDLCDAHFIRLRRIAAAAQRTWDTVRCIGTRPQHAHRSDSSGNRETVEAEEPSAERDSFARAMMATRASARLDLMMQFGVEWLDPTGDRKLLERLLTFPLHVFRVGNRPRGLAREIGRGLLPNSVRLRRTRHAQFPDPAAWFALRAKEYREAFQSIRDSSACAAILDIPKLEPVLETLCAGRGSLADAALLHRALDIGLFAVRYESSQRNDTHSWTEAERGMPQAFRASKLVSQQARQHPD
jgi:asparagine synthase (glutamine-hydrolysing)